MCINDDFLILHGKKKEKEKHNCGMLYFQTNVEERW